MMTLRLLITVDWKLRLNSLINLDISQMRHKWNVFAKKIAFWITRQYVIYAFRVFYSIYITLAVKYMT